MWETDRCSDNKIKRYQGKANKKEKRVEKRDGINQYFPMISLMVVNHYETSCNLVELIIAGYLS